MAEVKTMLQEDYGCTVKQITTRNPQTNAILERIHQTIENMIRTFQLPTNQNVDEEDPFTGLLCVVAFATRATVHTTLDTMPNQLVFGWDTIVNEKFQSNWEAIKARKQELIDKNNAKENAKRTQHTYCVGDKILLKTESSTKFGKDPYEGPYDIVKVNDNGTVKYMKGSVIDTVNIRNIHPFKA